MEYSVQPLTDALKAAREKKALSQRAFSARIGVPQSRLSKIESGAVDLRASSLLAIARALDLDVMLVPRQLVPAVTSLINQAIGQPGRATAESEPIRPAYRLDDEDADA